MVIRRFEYDPAAQALDVEFVSGRRYRYADVPDEVARSFREAFAKGRFFNAHIRDHYSCTELAAVASNVPAVSVAAVRIAVGRPRALSAALV